MKTRIFADHKTVEISNGRIELQFAGLAALRETNTKRSI